MLGNSAAPRIAIFSHDAYGVGHVRRCLRIIQALAEQAPQAAILLITGAPPLDMFKLLPPNADYVKLPTIPPVDSPRAGRAIVGISLAEISLLRERLIQVALVTFAPDVLLVDNFPLGARHELLPSLHELRGRMPRTVLGLRDIVAPPEKLRHEWTRHDIYHVLDRYYDRILVYGMREILDISDAYALPSSTARKVHYCGYVTTREQPLRTKKEVREELGIRGPFVLASAGGGGDGLPLLETFVRALPLLPDVSAVVLAGELMKADDQARLKALAADRPAVVVRDHVPDLPSYMAAADLVVAMGGYNTVAEILALQSRAILVPRTWQSGKHGDRKQAPIDGEQLMRAQTLEKYGFVDLLLPELLSPEVLAERIAAALAGPRVAPSLDLDIRGAEHVAEHILELANEGGSC